MAVAACMLFAGKANAQLTLNVGYAPTTLTYTYGGNDTKMDMNGFFVGANYNINLTGTSPVTSMSPLEPTSASTPRPTRMVLLSLESPPPPRLPAPRC